MTSAPRKSLDRERELVAFYLATLNAHLAARGIDGLSPEQFDVEFELALVDYARMLFS